MGVSGSGKTTIGSALARALGASFVEADDLHSIANVARMRRGIPLDDVARAPWLRRVHLAIARRVDAGERVVVACSALKAAYRLVLLDGFDDAVVVYLHADPATLEHRLEARLGHYMPPSLLDSQLATLEEPVDAIVCDPSQDPASLVLNIQQALASR